MYVPSSAAQPPAFASLRYAVCEGPEKVLERAALFADSDGRRAHAVRQLPDGRWAGKLGWAEDIEHGLRDLE